MYKYYYVVFFLDMDVQLHRDVEHDFGCGGDSHHIQVVAMLLRIRTYSNFVLLILYYECLLNQ